MNDTFDPEWMPDDDLLDPIDDEQSDDEDTDEEDEG